MIIKLQLNIIGNKENTLVFIFLFIFLKSITKDS